MREPVTLHRVISTPAALDAASWPAGATVLRTAPDAAVVLGADDLARLTDSGAIVFRDTSWQTVTVDPSVGAEVMARHASWPPPLEGFAQGAVAGIAVKLLVAAHAWTFLVAGAYADEFAERIEEVVS